MARAWMSWSSGKDSALALAEIREAGDVEVTGLLVTMNAAADRVAMHAVRRTLLERQAAALGLPLHLVQLPWPCPNETYERLVSAALDTARAEDVSGMVFGDLFLPDIRAYREQMLAGTGITPLFPLWHRPTADLARHMIDRGIEAVLTCVDPRQLPSEFVGRRFDEQLLADLPEGVDPCGENGEFHTVVLNAPGFSERIEATIGEVVERDGFVFCDVLPATEATQASPGDPGDLGDPGDPGGPGRPRRSRGVDGFNAGLSETAWSRTPRVDARWRGVVGSKCIRRVRGKPVRDRR